MPLFSFVLRETATGVADHDNHLRRRHVALGRARARSALIESEGIPLGPQMRESVGIDSTWGAGLWRRPILRICARG